MAATDPSKQAFPSGDFPAWTTVDEMMNVPQAAPTPPTKMKKERSYFPILDTVRLYAGWLMAWYLAIYALGYYQQTRELPFALSYIENLYRSPMVFSFTLAAFLFLFFTSIHRLLKGGRFLGIVLTLLATGVFLLYRRNVG